MLQVVLLVALVWTVLSVATLAGLCLLVGAGVRLRTRNAELIGAEGSSLSA